MLAHQVHFASFPNSPFISSSNIIARGFKAVYKEVCHPAVLILTSVWISWFAYLIFFFLSVEKNKASQKLVSFSLQGLNPKAKSRRHFKKLLCHVLAWLWSCAMD